MFLCSDCGHVFSAATAVMYTRKLLICVCAQVDDAGQSPPVALDRRSPKGGSPIKRVWARLSDSQRTINFDDASLAGVPAYPR